MEETQEKKSYSWLILVVLLVAVGAMYVPKLLNKPVAEVPKMEEKAGTQVTATPATPVEVKDGQITIEAGSFYFKPNLIKVKKGDKVKVVLNSVSMMHNFYLDEFKVKSENVKSGDSTSFEFTADKAGEFEFYCAIGQHRANGQVGKLIVTE